jgi:type II secretory pathway pseudopilin PulG
MKNGFTLIELAVVMTIMILISIVGLASFVGRRNTSDLSDATKQIGAILREAQAHSTSDDGGVAWGVHLANTTNTPAFYALFKTSYSVANTVSYYRLPTTVGYVTSTLGSGSSTDIIFTQLSGIASASTTIGLRLLAQSSQSSSISVASSGAVSY